MINNIICPFCDKILNKGWQKHILNHVRYKVSRMNQLRIEIDELNRQLERVREKRLMTQYFESIIK